MAQQERIEKSKQRTPVKNRSDEKQRQAHRAVVQRVVADPSQARPEELLKAQKAYGNQALSRLVGGRDSQDAERGNPTTSPAAVGTSLQRAITKLTDEDRGEIKATIERMLDDGCTHDEISANVRKNFKGTDTFNAQVQELIDETIGPVASGPDDTARFW